MKRKITLAFGIGLIVGGLFLGSYSVYSAIQSQVGINIVDGASPTVWKKAASIWDSTDGQNKDNNDASIAIIDTHSLPLVLNTAGTLDVLRGGITGDNTAGTGLLSSANLVFDGTNWDRLRSVENTTDATAGLGFPAIGNFLWNGSTWDKQREAPSADAQARTGLAAAVAIGFNGTTFDRFATSTTNAGFLKVDSTGFDGALSRSLRTTSAANLTATTSAGVQVTAPLATKSCTSSPAAATQATCTIAAGGASVRHIAASVTACTASAGTAQTPIQVNLRDGATGAGTIIWSLKFATPINTSACETQSLPAFPGTANTAMTLEFAAAGVAASEQTVTLQAYSVN